MNEWKPYISKVVTLKEKKNPSSFSTMWCKHRDIVINDLQWAMKSFLCLRTSWIWRFQDQSFPALMLSKTAAYSSETLFTFITHRRSYCILSLCHLNKELDVMCFERSLGVYLQKWFGWLLTSSAILDHLCSNYPEIFTQCEGQLAFSNGVNLRSVKIRT